MAERNDRNTWTDERLNDLAQRVDTGFKELRADMRAQGAEINQRLAAQDEKMDRMFESLHGDMTSMQRDMISMHRTMVIGMATILASTVGAVVGSNVFLG